jgi:hypothetical protein
MARFSSARARQMSYDPTPTREVTEAAARFVGRTIEQEWRRSGAAEVQRSIGLSAPATLSSGPPIRKAAVTGLTRPGWLRAPEGTARPHVEEPELTQLLPRCVLGFDQSAREQRAMRLARRSAPAFGLRDRRRASEAQFTLKTEITGSWSDG